MKVLLVNSYPMDEAYASWQKGIYPGQHLWGAIELKNHFRVEVVILRHERFKWLNQIGERFRIHFLDQQLRALWALRKADILYSPYGSINTKLIIFLKWLGLVRKPIVVLVHHRMFSFNGEGLASTVKRKMVLQYDAIGFLSRRLRRELSQDLKLTDQPQYAKFYNVEWGIERSFYERALKPNTPERYHSIVSAGKTNRDYNTLLTGLRDTNIPVKIWCGDDPELNLNTLPSNITVTKALIRYDELLKQYADARLILIPLHDKTTGTQGLTSLYDAIGMGKPVVMSRNPNVDLDIEAEGIGRWVRVGNAEDWRRTVTDLYNNPSLLHAMGERSLKLARTRFNTDVFAHDLLGMFNAALAKVDK